MAAHGKMNGKRTRNGKGSYLRYRNERRDEKAREKRIKRSKAYNAACHASCLARMRQAGVSTITQLHKVERADA